jgi:DNA-directed RNA polymerase specialized sigma24 family protein
MTNDEVSEITGISKTAVKANLYHARKSISDKIEKYL